LNACVIDGAPATLAAVGKMVDDQASQYGLAVDAARDDIIADVLSQKRAGGIAGGQLAKDWQAGKDIAFQLSALQSRKMPQVLAALEALRGAKQLDPIMDLVRNSLHDQRLEVAILSVQHHLGGEWQTLMGGLSEEDATAIRNHVFGGLEAGDQGELAPIKHGGAGYDNPSASDDDWIKGFLAFVHAGPDPLGDGTGKTCSFDGASMPIQRAIDAVVEQAGLAGRMIEAGQVAAPLAKLAAQPAKAAPGTIPAPQYSVSYAFPLTGHVDVKTGEKSKDELRSQASYTGTIALHPDDKAGPELSWTVQVAATNKTWAVQQILSGPQAAWAWPFLNGALQIQLIANALWGLANSEKEATGKVAMVPSTQVGVSGQVTYAILGNTVLVGFQMGPSATMNQGANPTADLAAQAFIQIQWK
jgi:hypothetical protein